MIPVMKKQEIIYDVVILGAGASGLMAATQLKQHSIAIIDHNDKPGKKILISGGGKCNVTNESVSTDNYLGDPEFIKPILAQYTSKNLLDFLARHGVVPKIRSEGQYFCQKSADEIVGVFRKEIQHAEQFYRYTIQKVSIEKELFRIHTDKKTFLSRFLIVATGGLSYTSVGASGIGYTIAESFGHTIRKTSPGLVGMTVQKEQFWMKELSGISFEVAISVNGKKFINQLLFAHKGISGPVVLNASNYWNKGQMILDFWPKGDIQKIDRLSRKNITTLLPLPKRFTKLFLDSLNLSDKSAREYSKEEWKKFNSLHHYEMAPAGTFGYTKAEVTKGGINTDELFSSCESKLQKNLYFIGEALDVTGELGGYNLQWAFASAATCAHAISV